MNQFSDESDGISHYDMFNVANNNPYNSLQISCNYYDENEYSHKFKNLKNLSMLSLTFKAFPQNSMNSENFCCFSILLHAHQILYFCKKLGRFLILLISRYIIILPYIQFTCRENRQGGGVGLYFKNGLQIKIIKEKSIFLEFIIETIVAEVILPNNKKSVVVSIYRPPTSHPTLSQADQFEQFLELFTNLISDLQNCYNDLYILGDLNIDVLKYDSYQPAQDYVDLLFSYGLLQVITKPTRYANSTATLIDHVITSPKSSHCNTAILTSKISNHFPIIYILDSAKTRASEKNLIFS